MIFELALSHQTANLVVNNEDNSVYVSKLSVWSLPLENLMFLELAYLQTFVLRTSKINIPKFQFDREFEGHVFSASVWLLCVTLVKQSRLSFIQVFIQFPWGNY